MSDLENEANEYVNNLTLSDNLFRNIYIAGANSNYVKQQTIKGKIKVLESVFGVLDEIDEVYYFVLNEIKKLEKQLETI